MRASFDVGDRSFEVRAAARSDLESLRVWKNANRHAFFHKEEISPDEQLAWFEEFEARGDGRMFVLVHAGELIACVGFRRREPAGLELFNLILGDTRWARTGLMGAFYTCVETELAQRGIGMIELDVITSNEPAVAWYRKQGFTVRHEGDEFLTLEKQLNHRESRPQRVVIAGGGCAGLAAGLALQKRGFETVILERLDRVGGLAGGVEIEGNTYEYGPHIFHTTDPEILEDVKTICADVLEDFERTIKIKFAGRYFDYPLSIFDILTKLPPWTVAHACVSLAWHFTRGVIERRPAANSEEALRRCYGDVLYRIFFRDYIHKVWGMGPDAMAASFAQQRMPHFSLRRMFAKVWRKFVPEKPKEISIEGYVENVEGEYFTTRKGFSLICRAFADEYLRLGGEVRLGATVTRVDVSGGRASSVTCTENGESHEIPCDWFVSTLPINRMPQLLHPPANEALLHASSELLFRGIVFVGLLVKRRSVLPASFMYFRDKSFNRITDLTRFKVEVEPPGATILVAEITCQPGDAPWKDEEEMAQTVIEELVGDGLIEAKDVLESHVFKAEHGYPIYRVGYEGHLATALAELDRYENVATIGRQGRFAYINTHVAMKMGYELARDLARRTQAQG